MIWRRRENVTTASNWWVYVNDNLHGLRAEVARPYGSRYFKLMAGDKVLCHEYGWETMKDAKSMATTEALDWSESGRG